VIRKLTGRLQRASKSGFARDALYLQIGAGVSMAANLVTSVVLFRLLGADRTGQYFEAVNLFTLLYFLGNVGLAQVTVARVSESVGRGDSSALVKSLGLFLRGHGSFLIAMGIAGAASSPFLGVAFRMGWDVGVWSAWLCLAGILSLPFYVTQCALQGTRRMRLLAEMENLKEITRAHLVLVGALVVNGPEGAILGEALASVFSAIYAWLGYRKARLEPGVPLPSAREILHAARQTQWSEIRPLLRASFVLALQKNLTALAPNVFPRLMLSYFGTSRDVAFLNLAHNLMKIPLLGLQGVSRTIIPVIGQLRGSGQIHLMKKALTRIMLLSGGTVTAVSTLWAISLYWIIPALYTDSALPCLALVPWLLVSMAIAGFAVGLEGFFLVTNRLDIAFRSTVFTFFAAIPPGLLAVALWKGTGAVIYILLNHLSPGFLVLYVFLNFQRLAAGAAAPVGAPAPSETVRA
jgi:O-antigen/teichoic acid export membrane protein